MTKHFLVLIFVILFLKDTVAQNLVNNPGFEEYRGKGIAYSNDVTTALFWKGMNTADYFNSNDNLKPNYEYRRQLVYVFKARTGNAYSGIRIQKAYREFIQNELKEPLIAGEAYIVSFYISLSRNSLFQLENFGFSFSEEPVEIKHVFRKYSAIHVSINKEDIVNKDWYLISTSFIAKGKEKYLIIGNFNPNPRKELSFRPDVKINSQIIYDKFKKEKEAYYYIDDVSLIPANGDKNNQESKKNIYQTNHFTYEFITEDEIGTGMTFTLKNIYFEFNKAVLINSSYNELDKLFNMLNTRSSMTIKITGHTDNVGSDTYNLELSGQRAKSVVDYLVKKGIDPGRFSWEGKGSTEPVGDNNTEIGRQQNRRVEIYIVSE